MGALKMASNTTFMDSANTILDIFNGVSSNLGDALGLLLMGILAIIIFMVFQNNDIKHLLLFEGFMLSVVGLLMVIMGWLSMTYLMIPVLLLAGAIFFNVKQ
jgi:hypothetical protein